MIPFAANAAATAAAKIAKAFFEWPEQPPKLLLPLGISSPGRRRTEPRPWPTCTEKLVKIARQVPCGRTDTRTDMHSLQYFATAPAGDVIITLEACPLVKSDLTSNE